MSMVMPASASGTSSASAVTLAATVRFAVREVTCSVLLCGETAWPPEVMDLIFASTLVSTSAGS
jgi:hypothetical protein